MQAQAQRFMDDISICCIHRFQKLVSEPEGNILIEQPTVSDLAFLERGVSFTTPERVQEFCSKNVNSNISLTLDVQSPVSPMLARQQYSPDKATRLMSNYDVTEGDFVVLNLDGEKSSPRFALFTFGNKNKIIKCRKESNTMVRPELNSSTGTMSTLRLAVRNQVRAIS
mmetsp:Transcript_16284/g.44169  ORF Transcript_16284/g.44169 Transcript_16284/m.44169 type:complete len:169 (+) Transcript_16284:723-1229(+)